MNQRGSTSALKAAGMCAEGEGRWKNMRSLNVIYLMVRNGSINGSESQAAVFA